MGICFSKKNEIKTEKKQKISEVDKSKINQNIDNPQLAQKIPKSQNPECNFINNNKSSPISNRTSILDQKYSKDDLKSSLKEEKKEVKTDKISEIPKLVKLISSCLGKRRIS